LPNSVKTYRDLFVWQKAMDLVVTSYDLAKKFPHQEIYVLTAQIQRAAVSIPANIAEGHGRKHRGDLHHLSMARGSSLELETHLLIAVRLAYLRSEDIETIMGTTDEVGRMLSGLIQSLRSKTS
jgi:four helix bundle protein